MEAKDSGHNQKSTEDYGIKSIAKIQPKYREGSFKYYLDYPRIEFKDPIDLIYFHKVAEQEKMLLALDSVEGSVGKAKVYKKEPRTFLKSIRGDTKLVKIAVIDGAKVDYLPDATELIKKYGIEKLGWKEDDKTLDFILALE